MRIIFKNGTVTDDLKVDSIRLIIEENLRRNLPTPIIFECCDELKLMMQAAFVNDEKIIQSALQAGLKLNTEETTLLIFDRETVIERKIILNEFEKFAVSKYLYIVDNL